MNSNTVDLIYNIIGIIGVAIIIVTYFLLQTEKINSTGLTRQCRKTCFIALDCHK